MSEHDLVLWLIAALGGILSALGWIVLAVGNGIRDELKNLNESVRGLTVSSAVAAERLNHHEVRIEKLEMKK